MAMMWEDQFLISSALQTITTHKYVLLAKEYTKEKIEEAFDICQSPEEGIVKALMVKENTGIIHITEYKCYFLK